MKNAQNSVKKSVQPPIKNAANMQKTNAQKKTAARPAEKKTVRKARTR